MAFFKKYENGSIETANEIYTPTGIFNESNKDATEGWQWFDTKEQAYTEFAKSSSQITRKQLKLALLDTQDLNNIETIIANQPKEIQIEWADSDHVLRDNPVLLNMIAYLRTLDEKWTDEYVDEIFDLALTK